MTQGMNRWRAILKLLKSRLIFLNLTASLLLLPASGQALTSVVRLTGGGDDAFREMVATRLTQIMNSLEPRTWDALHDYCTAEGLACLRDLTERTSCRNVRPLYETKLLDLLNGAYEVRDLKVKVRMDSTKGDPFQYLVFNITSAGLVYDVRFSMEKTIYDDIIKKGEAVQDFAFRQQIVQFLEVFRTAHNRKDIAFIEKVFSEYALIIVGRVLKEKVDAPNYMEHSTLSRDRIEFIKVSKKDYIERLRGVFERNSFVKVDFDSIDVKRSPDNPNIYGVMLRQHWNSSTYSDHGYLFLLLDFTDVNNPTIHVRSWQPERFTDGSVFNLGDLIVVPSAKDSSANGKH